MKLLRTLLRYSRGGLVLASLAGIVAGLASAGVLALVNGLLRQGGGNARQLLVFAALAVVAPLAGITSTYLLMRLGQQAIVDLRLDLSRRILATPLHHLERLGAHRLLASLTGDVMAVTQAVAMVPLVCMNGALVAGCLAYLGHLSWRLLVVLLVLLLIGAASYRLPAVLGARRLRLFRETEDSLFGLFRGLTDGIKELKLNGRRRHDFLDRLEARSLRLRDLGVSAITLFSTADSWGRFLLFVVLGGLLFGAPHLQPGDRAVLNGFVLALLFMLGPLEGLLGAIPQVGRATVALDKIESLGFDLGGGQDRQDPQDPQDPQDDGAVAGGAEPVPASWQRLELRGVTHAYDGERAFTLGPVDLQLAPGEVLFITGGNGSGKTTLAKLITGLYTPDAGEILLDGKVIDAGGRELYRQSFSAVFADFHLFDEWLGIERHGLEARVRLYLERLQLERKVTVDADRLATGELSQGQRKRLALLVAYLEDRPIYLFDEWAADQDPLFKEIFYRQLLPELKARRKGVCVISHDDRYYSLADRVLKLEDGRVEA